MINNDLELLRQYAASQSEPAFETLVTRHAGLVYSAALRHVQDPHLAGEITQTVFIILARKAGSISPQTILPGWLYRTTRHAASAALKMQYRRERREQEAHMQAMIDQPQSDPVWEQLAPLLDQAMTQLRDQDHDAIVLRYFQNQNLRQVGAALGVDEYAAQKRVSRALEKLRKFFTQRGVSSTAALIAAAISVNSVHAAPALLAKSLTTVAVAKGAVASASTLTLTKGTLTLMAWTKTKIAIVAAATVLLAAGTTTVIIGSQPRPAHGIPADWSTLRGSPDQWSSTNGVIYGNTIAGDSLIASSKEYGDVTVSAILGTTNREASLAIRMKDADNGYIVVFAPTGLPNGWPARLLMVKRVAGEESEIQTYQGRVFSTLGQTAKVTVIAKGPWFDVRLNDVTVYRVKDTTFSSGFIGLRMYGSGDSPCDSTFSNLTFR